MSPTAPRLAGVIGDPIAHSRSPRLHGHWLRRYRIDGHYVPLRTAPQDLAETLRLLPRLGFAGLNVTIPHKVAALALAAEATPRAARIGAANTLTFKGGMIQADNTDGEGFLRSLRSGAPRWNVGQPAVVLGAGGAARAVADALLESGVSEVRLLNRTPSRAEALAADLGAHHGPRMRVLPWGEMPDAMADAGLLVNTTSLGMAGLDPLIVDLSSLPASAVVADIVYAPLVTPLLAAAGAHGLTTVDGLGMLLHQAAPGFARWFGVEPVVDDELRRVVLA